MLSKHKQKFLDKVKGPVFPIPVPFLKNGQVDFSGIEKYVDFLIRKGVTSLMVTVGTSRFDVLTTEEMKEVNQTVVKMAANRALTIVTTPTRGPTSQAIEFAEHAEKIGADGILAVFPDRFYTENGIYTYFKEICSSCSIGVLIHEMAITAGRGGLGPKVQYPSGLIEQIATIENMVGMKEESHDPGLIYSYNRLFKNRFLIIGGAGGMRAFTTAFQWGQPAYLVGIGNFVPEVEQKFYSYLAKNNLEKAKQIVFEMEEPFFAAAVNAGWHIALKEAMAYVGLMSPYERSPMNRLKKSEREQIYKNMPKNVRVEKHENNKD